MRVRRYNFFLSNSFTPLGQAEDNAVPGEDSCLTNSNLIEGTPLVHVVRIFQRMNLQLLRYL